MSTCDKRYRVFTTPNGTSIQHVRALAKAEGYVMYRVRGRGVHVMTTNEWNRLETGWDLKEGLIDHE